MPRLNPSLNQPLVWNNLLQDIKRRIEVDLQEVERVLQLARRTPGLSHYEEELQHLSIFFNVATRYYQQNDPDQLADLVSFWERYREAVIQRYTAVTPVELRAADKVVGNVFRRFLQGIPNQHIAYSPTATPLVYGGQGGLYAYFTHPPGWNRPFAIINLPHAAFDHVWQWLALPHETGHDLYATVEGLASELEQALEQRMRRAVEDGEVRIPDIRLDLAPWGINYRIEYSGKDLLAKVWRSWANEAQADMVGLLHCGGAAIVALQQIIGFEADDAWDLFRTEEGLGDGPEVHPTSYIRNALNIAALRLIGGGHGELADEIDTRFQALRPQAQHITWRLAASVQVAQVPVAEMVRSAELAAEVLINHRFPSLGGKSYRELGDFTGQDQQVVDTMTDLLIAGDSTFAQVDRAEPRHALAATVFAFEKELARVATVNRTFLHFV